MSTLGEKIDRLAELRDARRELAEQDKPLKEEFNKLEQEVLDALYAQDLPAALGRKARATRSEQIYANPTTSYEEVFEWAKENDAFYIFKKSLNSAPLRELSDMGQLPDCITLGKKVTLNLRKT